MTRGLVAPFFKELMEQKWFYLGNKGVLAKGDQIKQLENHCNERPEDYSKFERVPFNTLRDLIQEAKDFVKAKEEEKPKRKRRTKAEIEADKASE